MINTNPSSSTHMIPRSKHGLLLQYQAEMDPHVHTEDYYGHTVAMAKPEPGLGGCSDGNGDGLLKVVQIFDPVLVKTDSASFPSLVQKLTGRSDICSRYWNTLRELNICSNGAMVEVRGKEMMDILDSMVSVSGTIGHELDQLLCPSSNSSMNFSSSMDGLYECDKSSSKHYVGPIDGRHSYHREEEEEDDDDDDDDGALRMGEVDIYAGLLADTPVPDITLLPPLLLPGHFAVYH